MYSDLNPMVLMIYPAISDHFHIEHDIRSLLDNMLKPIGPDAD